VLAPAARPPSIRPPLLGAAQSSVPSTAPAPASEGPLDAALADATGFSGDRIDDASAAAERRLEQLADAVARRTQLRLLQEKAGDDARQAELDRLAQEFDFAQKERAELLREFNLMRELALEQIKKDDEAVKKWMALV
jgi:hypothetical protein